MRIRNIAIGDGTLPADGLLLRKGMHYPVKMLRFPLPVGPVALSGFATMTGSLWLGASLLAVPLMASAADVLPRLPDGPATSVDAPAPYRYLDWV